MMTNVVFDPYDGGRYNKSLSNLINAIGDNGYVVCPFQYALGFSKRARSIKVIHLNWFENLRGSNSLQIFYYFIKKLLFLLFFKLSGKKIIWSMHNKKPHEARSKYLSSLLVDILVKCSSRIMVYSELSREILNSQYKGINEKIVRVPHPNFINDYGKIQKGDGNKNDDKLRLLFLGEVRAYKNIELLIDAFLYFREDDVDLTIMGKTSSEEYKNDLIGRVKDRKNIHFKFEFISDEKIPSLLADCDLMVLPFDISSSLNSGSVILAFSYGKTVLCPEIGTILDLINKDCVLSYNYNSEEEHRQQLIAAIQQAIDLKKENADVFLDFGNKLKAEMADYYSKEKTRLALKELYTIKS